MNVNFWIECLRKRYNNDLWESFFFDRKFFFFEEWCLNLSNIIIQIYYLLQYLRQFSLKIKLFQFFFLLHKTYFWFSHFRCLSIECNLAYGCYTLEKMKTIKLWITNERTNERTTLKTNKQTHVVHPMKNDALQKNHFEKWCYHENCILFRRPDFVCNFANESARVREREREWNKKKIKKKKQINSKSNFHRITCIVLYVQGTVAKLLLLSFYI